MLALSAVPVRQSARPALSPLSNLTGNKNDNASSKVVETEKGLNFSGEKKDYNEVIGDYSKEELEGMEGSSIPENMKNIVKDYFDGLN